MPRQARPSITGLQGGRARWAGRNIKSYRFVLHAGCCGPMRLTSPVSIEVREGHATSVTPLEGARQPQLGGYERFNTIEKLFDVIEGAEGRKAASVSVSYEPALGYPVSITVDESKSAVDDDYTLRVERLEAIE